MAVSRLVNTIKGLLVVFVLLDTGDVFADSDAFECRIAEATPEAFVNTRGSETRCRMYPQLKVLCVCRTKEVCKNVAGEMREFRRWEVMGCGDGRASCIGASVYASQCLRLKDELGQTSEL